MTATPILESLAKEFSVPAEAVQSVFEMVDAGLCAPFIGRFRRKQTSGLSESQIRRLQNRRLELEELDRRRGTMIRTLERDEGVDDASRAAIQKCMDRFELEDHFVPHRRPEPEVQLALDRGLGALADLLVKPVRRAERQKDDVTDGSDAAPENAAPGDAADGAPADSNVDAAPGAPPTEGADTAAPDDGPRPVVESTSPDKDEHSPAGDAPAAAPPAAPEAAATPDEPTAAPVQPSEPVATEPVPASAGTPPAGDAAPPEAPLAAGEGEAGTTPTTPIVSVANDAQPIAGLPASIAITPELMRLCEPFVNPDKGIHTEAEALAGAVRILSDRLGRNSHLRTLVRRMLRKRGTLRARPLMDESKAGRHKPLLRIKQPLRQAQGHRLLALRQAQKERVLNTQIVLDTAVALPKVRVAFGKHTEDAYGPLLDEIARQALEVRLLPVVEADVRLELKERGDAEALRFLSQHLRQILLTPPLGRMACVGADINAKGDWTLACLDADGVVQSVTKIEVGEKDAAALGQELAAALEGRSGALAVGHGRGPRTGAIKMRAAVAAAGLDIVVTITNEVGLSSYANSELARAELSDYTVPQRMAISLGRRLQDPMAEILKVDPRHLGLGSEQGLVSKANAKRAFVETIESCAAHVGCDLNTAQLSVLQNIPGLDRATAKRLIEARTEKPFTSREQLRADGLLTEAQWTSAIAFLRIPGAENPLDRTSLHPETYDLATRLLEEPGGSVAENLGRPGVTKGLRRTSYDVDEATWRDLMRELTQPGRDPRPGLMRPSLLSPDTDSAHLVKDKVVEGIITNVASFGAFVDIGLRQDAMIHISEMSARYVRDARELLSIGQVIRAKILDPSGQRMALSLKNVPMPERGGRGGRPGGGPRGGGESRGGGRGGGRGGRGDRHREPEVDSNLRAAQTRRDGIGTRASRSGRGGPGRGRRPGGPGRGRDREGREERVNLDKINASANEGTSFNPFASFFNKEEEEKSKDE